MGAVVFMFAAAILLTAWLAARPSDGRGPLHRGTRAAGWPGSRWVRGRASGHETARWASRRDLRPLMIGAPEPGRLVLGVAQGRLVAADAGHSLLVVGPTQSFKTTGLAVPALLEWRGPILAASVKGDLLRDTVAWRESQGRVWIYDPTA
jgi:type IV secretory pathway TraG/TraD family ATPase VirD4